MHCRRMSRGVLPPACSHALSYMARKKSLTHGGDKKVVADKNISAIQPIGQPESVDLLVSNWLLGHHPYFNVKP